MYATSIIARGFHPLLWWAVLLPVALLHVGECPAGTVSEFQSGICKVPLESVIGVALARGSWEAPRGLGPAFLKVTGKKTINLPFQPTSGLDKGSRTVPASAGAQGEEAFGRFSSLPSGPWNLFSSRFKRRCLFQTCRGAARRKLSLTPRLHENGMNASPRELYSIWGRLQLPVNSKQPTNTSSLYATDWSKPSYELQEDGTFKLNHE